MPDKIMPLLKRLERLETELDSSRDLQRCREIRDEMRGIRDELKRLQDEAAALFQ